MKKLLFGLIFLVGAVAINAQGLEGVILEEYYEYTGAQTPPDNPLTVGSKTYRVFVDLADGYTLAAVYGDANHALSFTTTSSFYNNEDRGDIDGSGIASNRLNEATTFIDSWISIGAASGSHLGIPLSLDTDGSVITALSGADGLVTGSAPVATVVPPTLLDSWVNTGNTGSFTTNNGSWAALPAISGPAGSGNAVLVAQVTVLAGGELSFELNLQLEGPGGTENWVASNPLAGELTSPELSQTTVNLAPTVTTVSVSNTTPFTGELIDLTATATDDDGTVEEVEFFVNGSSVGVDNTPGDGFSIQNYDVGATAGTFVVTAVATDDKGAVSTGSPTASFTTSVNAAPVATITAPGSSTYEIGANPTVDISISANDAEGDTIDRVELFANGTLIHTYPGSDTPPVTGTYTWSFPDDGVYNLTAVAYDAGGRAGDASSVVTLTVTDASLVYSLGADAVVSEPCYASSSICLPLIAEQSMSAITGFDLVVNFDPAKVTPTGVVRINPALHTGSLEEGDYRLRVEGSQVILAVFQSPVDAGLDTWNGTGEVLCIEFAKNSGFASNDSADFSVASLRESYETGYDDVDAAFIPSTTYETFEDTFFRGQVLFWADGSPIQGPQPTYNSAFVRDGGAYSVQVNEFGEFAYDFSIPSPLYPISVRKDIANMMFDADTLMKVYNGFDAYLTELVLVNDPSFKPSIYQLIAMDVNVDGKVTAGDVTQINQRSVQLREEFANGISFFNEDWRWIAQENLSKPRFQVAPAGLASKELVPSLGEGSKTLDLGFDPECRFAEPDNFIMVLLGDIDGSWSGIAPDGSGLLKSLKSSSSTVLFDLANASYEENFVDIPVMASSDEPVNSVSFALMFDTEKMDYMSVSKLTDVKGLSNSFEGNVWNVSYSLTEYNTEEPLFLVRFMVKEAFNSEHITFAQGFVNGKEANTMITEAATGINREEVMDLRIYPNPATDYLNVETAVASSIELIDMNGRVLFTSEIMTDQAEINVSDLNSGLYFIKVANEKSTSVEKVVIAR